MIDENDVQNKTPALEQWLMDIARAAGAERAIKFDGSVVDLVINNVNKLEETK